MKTDKELKEILFDLFDGSDDADEIVSQLRSLNTERTITDDEYNYIMEKYEEWLGDWHDENFDNPDHHAILKHDNYDASEMIQITRLEEDLYRLFYESENYEFLGTHDEVIEELSDHISLKKFGDVK